MSYTSGDKILDDHYNIFATGTASGTADHNTANINTIWASGSGDKGYQQGSPLAAVSAGTTVSATQWATLMNRITTVANHQGTSITPMTAPSSGQTIDAVAALGTNLANVYNNRLNAAAVGSLLSTNGNVTNTTAWGGAGQPQNLDARCTFTFASNDHLRAFFNAGGRLRVDADRTGGTASNKNTAWTQLLDAAGLMYVTGSGVSKNIGGSPYTGVTKYAGSGTPTTYVTNQGVLDLTSSTWYTVFLQYHSTAPYTANFIRWYLRYDAPNIVHIYWRLTDNANTNTDEQANGTFTFRFRIGMPSTTYLSNTWGTPTMTTSTVAF